jgi:hypothetical protein
LADYGVRASGRAEPAVGAEGLRQVEGPDPDGYESATYLLTGMPTWERPETWEWVIQSGGIEVIAHLSNMYPPPVLGKLVTVRCSLSVIPEYEWLEFGLPNVRRDWTVDAIRIQHRALELHEDGWHPTHVVETEDLEEMHRWTDERADHGSVYLLDLRPLN